MLCEGWRAFYYYFSSRVFLFFFPLVPVLFSAFCGWEVDGVGFLLFQVWEYFCPSEGPKLGECGGGGGGGVCVCVCVSWEGRCGRGPLLGTVSLQHAAGAAGLAQSGGLGAGGGRHRECLGDGCRLSADWCFYIFKKNHLSNRNRNANT